MGMYCGHFLGRCGLLSMFNMNPGFRFLWCSFLYAESIVTYECMHISAYKNEHKHSQKSKNWIHIKHIYIIHISC